jgi:hypothetical protein
MSTMGKVRGNEQKCADTRETTRTPREKHTTLNRQTRVKHATSKRKPTETLKTTRQTKPNGPHLLQLLLPLQLAVVLAPLRDVSHRKADLIRDRPAITSNLTVKRPVNHKH